MNLIFLFDSIQKKRGVHCFSLTVLLCLSGVLLSANPGQSAIQESMKTNGSELESGAWFPAAYSSPAAHLPRKIFDAIKAVSQTENPSFSSKDDDTCDHSDIPDANTRINFACIPVNSTNEKKLFKSKNPQKTNVYFCSCSTPRDHLSWQRLLVIYNRCQESIRQKAIDASYTCASAIVQRCSRIMNSQPRSATEPPLL